MMRPFFPVLPPPSRWLRWALIVYRWLVLFLLIYIAYTGTP